ncbi:MAG: DUF2752 domain-containing protein [Lachnospiraceae bacterium]|nr:DUF2752 domain-containing protein [Lachnospiraceae bacterium]
MISQIISNQINYQKQERLLKIIRPIVIILAIGLLYWATINTFNIGIPCLFHLITGLYCPGCGISRMCICLLSFDFTGALSANIFIFSLIPLFAGGFMYHASEYVAYGKYSITKAENIIIWCLIIFAITFAVFRNMFPIDILVP